MQSDMEKTFSPILNSIARYEVQFSAPLYAEHTNTPIIDTDEFYINGEAVKINNYTDAYVDGFYKLKSYRMIGEDEVIVNPDIGYIDVANGVVVFDGINITSYNTTKGRISIYAKPNSFDIAPKRNQLVIINMSEVEVTPEIDTIATGGTVAGIGYNVTPRH
jgi:hypothetical protein